MKTAYPITAIALLLAGLACGRQQPIQAPVLATVKVRLAETAGAAGNGWIAATLGASRHATLATRLAASVKRIHVAEGQPVAAGTLLISLDDQDLQAALRAAEAALAGAAAHHRRIEALMAQQAAIPAEQDQARTQLAQAQAAVSQIKANLGYTQIRAPFAGAVQSRITSEGAFVGPGMPLLEFEGQGDLELLGSVSETEAKGLRIGEKLAFEADGQVGTAVISALAAGGDPVSHRATLRARVPAGARLRSGSFARLRLPGGAATSELSVPRSALVQRGELNGVFVHRAGKAELRWLSLGEAQAERWPVRAGLAAGEQVIDQPGLLTDGQPVEVQK